MAHQSTRTARFEAAGDAFRWPRLYDWTAAIFSLGREGRIRERMLEVAAVGEGEDVLDVGCGTGTLALAAKRRVGRDGSVRGIDPSEEMIARAREKAKGQGLSIAFEMATAQALPYSDGMFDVVLCTLTLHHVPEDSRARAVDEMHRVLGPGGRVVIVELETPRELSWFWRPVAMLHERHAGPVLDDAVDLLNGAGFEGIARAPLGFAGLGYAIAHRDRA